MRLCLSPGRKVLNYCWQNWESCQHRITAKYLNTPIDLSWKCGVALRSRCPWPAPCRHPRQGNIPIPIALRCFFSCNHTLLRSLRYSETQFRSPHTLTLECNHVPPLLDHLSWTTFIHCTVSPEVCKTSSVSVLCPLECRAVDPCIVQLLCFTAKP